jgi:CheY-like chemotaxis protein
LEDDIGVSETETILPGPDAPSFERGVGLSLSDEPSGAGPVGGKSMSKSVVLDRKRILAVDDEPDITALIGQEISDACSGCSFETASSYQEAVKLLESRDYDLVILDIMGVRGFDLLELAVKKNLKVAMLTAHALTPEALKRSYDMGARAYLPKEKLGEIVPFLEDVLTQSFESGWERLMDRLRVYFNAAFGRIDWEKEVGFDWRKPGRPY